MLQIEPQQVCKNASLNKYPFACKESQHRLFSRAKANEYVKELEDYLSQRH